jgi:hypothetical protein
MTAARTFVYVETDIPPGLTVAEWRRARAGARDRRWRIGDALSMPGAVARLTGRRPVARAARA